MTASDIARRATLRDRAAAVPRPRIRPLLVVVPAPARHALLWTVASLLLFTASVFGAVTFSALAADDAVRATQLEAELRDADLRYGQLLAEVAQLETPARIVEAAERLGLERVGDPRQLRVGRLLPADGAVTEARPGDRTDGLKPLLADG